MKACKATSVLSKLVFVAIFVAVVQEDDILMFNSTYKALTI